MNPFSAQSAYAQTMQTYTNSISYSRNRIQTGANSSVGINDIAKFYDIISSQRNTPDFFQREQINANRFLNDIISKLDEVLTQIQNLRETSFKAIDFLNAPTDRNSYQLEADEILTTLNDTFEEYTVNGLPVFKGYINEINYEQNTYIYHSEDSLDQFNIPLNEFSLESLDLNNVRLNTRENAQQSTLRIERAMQKINEYVGNLIPLRNQTQSEVLTIEKSNVRLREIQTISPDIDFLTRNNNFLNLQIDQEPSLPNFFSGADIRKATISFKV